MRHAILAVVALLCGVSAAFGQTPPTLPSNTVWGNLTPVTAPSRAVSLAQIQAAILYGETPVNDANYSATTADRNIVYTAISAARTVTLPSASSFSPGARVFIFDRSGVASSTKAISIAPTGADTINGANASFSLVISAYSGAFVETDGVSKWTATQNSVTAAQLPAGVDTNTLNAKTTAYSLATTDCGKTVTLGGSAFYTLTVGAASGFPATCSVVISNIDSGRAKKMAVNGITFPNGSFLWPLQSVILKNEANVWTVVADPGRWHFPADETFYVDPVNGNNSNDCLAATTGACLTPANALVYSCQYVDAGGFRPIIQLADDTSNYTTQINLCAVHGVINTGFTSVPTLRGNVATPANVRLSTTSANGVTAVNVPHAWRVEGIDFRAATSGTAIVTDVYSKVYVGANTFTIGTCCNVFQALNGGFIEWVSNFTIASPGASAGANVVMYANNQGKFVSQPITVTITGTPAWAFAFAYHFGGATSYIPGVTFSGSATGNRCNLITGGGIDTNGGGANYLPGNVACSGGAIVNPGWYN